MEGHGWRIAFQAPESGGVAKLAAVRRDRRAAMVTSFQVVFDCADPDRVMRFWSGALHYPVHEQPEGDPSWEAWLTEHGVPEETWNDSRALEDPDGRGPRLFF